MNNFKAGDIVVLDMSQLANTANPITHLKGDFKVIRILNGFPRLVDVVHLGTGSLLSGIFPSRLMLKAASKAVATPAMTPATTTKKFWIITLVENGVLKPATEPKKYATREQADTVSRMMAEKHAGQEFVVLEAVATSLLPRKTALTTAL